MSSKTAKALCSPGQDAATAEFQRRWGNLADLTRSPSDGSPLQLRSRSLRDGSAHVFPIVEGVPFLIPDLMHLLRDHYAICRRAGPTAPTLRQAVLARGDTVAGYLFGRRLTLSDFEPAPAGSMQFPAGTVEIVGDELFIWTEAQRYKAGTFQYSVWLYDSAPITDTDSLIAYVGVKPSYFLLEEKCPTIEIVKLYELLPFIGMAYEEGRWADLFDDRSDDERRSERSAPELGPAPGVLADAPLTEIAPDEQNTARRMSEANAVFFRSIFEEFQLDVKNGAVVDVGGGMGFLGAAMELAGAERPISFDVRRPSLYASQHIYPDCRRLVLAFADMFRWFLAPESCAFIAVRNNSAVCFATDLKSEQIQSFLRDCHRSLRGEGVLYLTTITNETATVDETGLANRPVSEYVAALELAGFHVLRLGKLGTQAALFCCKAPAREVLTVRMNAVRYARRAAALREYRSGSTERRVLLNYFFAAHDFAGELALEYMRTRATGFVFYGKGSVAYLLWYALYVNYALLPRAFFAVMSQARAGLMPSVRGRETRRCAGDRPIRVRTDDCFYAAAANGRWSRSFRPKVRTFIPGVSLWRRLRERLGAQAPAPWPAMTDGWVYPVVAGDLDEANAESITSGYFSGRIRALVKDGLSNSADDLAFEENVIRVFPRGFHGDQPRP